MKKLILTVVFTGVLAAFLIIAWLVGSPGDAESVVNFAHLRHLTETIQFRGETVDIVHVYANYPDYEWVGAAESGPEGIACVDDASRAAVLYLRHYELTGDTSSLASARPLLRFVLGMQADDGQFYNFIHADHSINVEGKTSFRSLGWWAARGVWAIGKAYETMCGVDSSFALQLKERLERTLPHLDAVLERRGETASVHGYRIPRWLLRGAAADATSEMMLGLLAWYRTEPDSALGEKIRAFAEGLMLMQEGDVRQFPYGLHRSWGKEWHMYGNTQTQALASAGALLGDSAMIVSAEREALGFYTRLLIQGFLKWMDLADPEGRKEYEQIAYGIRPMAVGLLRTYEATGRREYAVMAGLAAGWLLGNNPLGQQMYDPETGRCFDGISGPEELNRNSGAESTIEALLTLTEIRNYPEASHYLHYRRVSHGAVGDTLHALYRDSDGEELVVLLDRSEGIVEVLEGKEQEAFQRGG
jgi:hypothetical protein